MALESTPRYLDPDSPEPMPVGTLARMRLRPREVVTGVISAFLTEVFSGPPAGLRLAQLRDGRVAI